MAVIIELNVGKNCSRTGGREKVFLMQHDATSADAYRPSLFS
jgi:hypothetical protein